MMRLVTSILVAGALSAALASAATAGTYDRDHVYADNYGNLVIESASGYKRILVGEGHQARRLADYTGAGGPHVVYAEDGTAVSSDEGCYRPPVLVKGRSYMYGFDEGEIPLQGGPCR